MLKIWMSMLQAHKKQEIFLNFRMTVQPPLLFRSWADGELWSTLKEMKYSESHCHLNKQFKVSRGTRHCAVGWHNQAIPLSLYHVLSFLHMFYNPHVKQMDLSKYLRSLSMQPKAKHVSKKILSQIIFSEKSLMFRFITSCNTTPKIICRIF